MEHPESMQQVIDRLNDRRGLPPKEQKGQTLMFNNDISEKYFPAHHQAKITDRWVFKADNLDDLAKIEHLKAVINKYTLDEIKERLP